MCLYILLSNKVINKKKHGDEYSNQFALFIIPRCKRPFSLLIVSKLPLSSAHKTLAVRTQNLNAYFQTSKCAGPAFMNKTEATHSHKKINLFGRRDRIFASSTIYRLYYLHIIICDIAMNAVYIFTCDGRTVKLVAVDSTSVKSWNPIATSDQSPASSRHQTKSINSTHHSLIASSNA